MLCWKKQTPKMLKTSQKRGSSFKCAIKNTDNVKNIYLKFTGTSADLFHLDSFQFQIK